MIVALVAAVSIAAGANATLHCTTSQEEAAVTAAVGRFAGYYDPVRRVIVLSADTCAGLARVESGVRIGTQEPWDGYAIFTLAHELQHAHGVIDEQAADCGASRTFVRVAMLLGVTPRRARKLLTASRDFDGYQPGSTRYCELPPTL